jgi:hypothetical protein
MFLVALWSAAALAQEMTQEMAQESCDELSVLENGACVQLFPDASLDFDGYVPATDLTLSAADWPPALETLDLSALSKKRAADDVRWNWHDPATGEAAGGWPARRRRARAPRATQTNRPMQPQASQK